jgi:hypothetical protein
MMHIVATNLCVWLNVIIQETKHEILHFKQHEGGDTTEHDQHQVVGHGEEPVQIAGFDRLGFRQKTWYN